MEGKEEEEEIFDGRPTEGRQLLKGGERVERGTREEKEEEEVP